jgi:hypothetical protein
VPVSSPSGKLAGAIAAPGSAHETAGPHTAVPEPANQPGPSVTLLPRRNPGSSGIAEIPAVPAPPAEELPRRRRRELATPWWEREQQAKPAPEPQPAPAQPAAVSDTSAFFGARSQSAADRENPETPAAKQEGPPAGASIASIPTIPKGPTAATAPADDDVIYRRMLSEMLGDPHDLVNSPDLDWQSVWDRGWSLAAAAEDKPVESQTEHGLPVRKPGDRLVPGTANGTAITEEDQPDEDQGSLVGSNSGSRSGSEPQRAAARDPEAVRASFSSHFGGVRTGRSHARETSEGSDQE